MEKTTWRKVDGTPFASIDQGTLDFVLNGQRKRALWVKQQMLKMGVDPEQVQAALRFEE